MFPALHNLQPKRSKKEDKEGQKKSTATAPFRTSYDTRTTNELRARRLKDVESMSTLLDATSRS